MKSIDNSNLVKQLTLTWDPKLKKHITGDKI